MNGKGRVLARRVVDELAEHRLCGHVTLVGVAWPEQCAAPAGWRAGQVRRRYAGMSELDWTLFLDRCAPGVRVREQAARERWLCPRHTTECPAACPLCAADLGGAGYPQSHVDPGTARPCRFIWTER